MLETEEKYKAEDSLESGQIVASTYPSDMVEFFDGLATVIRNLDRVTGETISYDTSENAAVSVEGPFSCLVSKGHSSTPRFTQLRAEVQRFIRGEMEVGSSFTLTISVPKPDRVVIRGSNEVVAGRSYTPVPLSSEAAEEHDLYHSLSRYKRKVYRMYTRASFCDSVAVPGSELTIGFHMMEENVLGLYVSQEDGYTPNKWWRKWAYIRSLNREVED